MKTPYYFHTKWCWAKGITIYPKPLVSKGTVCKIVVSVNGLEKIGDEKYVADKPHNHTKMYDKIRELYKTIYEKQNEPLKI